MKRMGVFLVLLTGCPMMGPRETYLNEDIKTVLVLMPLNDSMYTDAPMKMWPYVEREVSARGYWLSPRNAVMDFYQQKKFTGDPGQINTFSCQELAQEFKADAVLYVNVAKWDRKTIGIYTSLTVAVEASLHRGKDGAVLWEGKGEAGESSLSTDWRDAAGETLHALLTNLERYAGPACYKAFASMPRAGYGPGEPK